MNIAYVRKSDKSVKEVAERFKEGLKAKKIELLGEKETAKGEGTLIYFVNPSWMEEIVAHDHTVAGLVPNAVLIMPKDGKTIVGILNPELVAGSGQFGGFRETAEVVNRDLRGIVNDAAGVGEPKLEKVKLYSTATCPYCKMEKEYLEKNKVPFDLVMVDADRKAAEEMVQKTGQMGVPVTELTFDDGDSEFIVGFDKGRLNSLLKIGA